MKYNKETREKFISAIEQGAGRVRACKVAGINYQTFLNWISDERKIEFVEDLKKAEEQGKLTLKEAAVESVTKAFKKHWQSAAWWLERVYPDEFKNKQQKEHSGEIKITRRVIK
jgi:transposase-like protein